MKKVGLGCAAVLLAFVAATAGAFSQDGHMVSGAIAYEELRASSPRTIATIVDIMVQHPDRGTFEVALGHTTGEERTRRLFMEMARWPDDIRKGVYDHPTWHYASKPLADGRDPPSGAVGDRVNGSALQAYALNLSVATDTHAPATERAIALCWLFHLIADIHQPLHAADEHSAAYPDGDHGGNLRFILDPQTQQPSSLHWYWDRAATQSGEPAPVRAAELIAKYPRRGFNELNAHGSHADDFPRWAAESYTLARTDAYSSDLFTSSSEASAVALAPNYAANSAAVAERRLTLASYRLADLLATALADQAP